VLLRPRGITSLALVTAFGFRDDEVSNLLRRSGLSSNGPRLAQVVQLSEQAERIRSHNLSNVR
jgi:hypothetical protein